MTFCLFTIRVEIQCNRQRDIQLFTLDLGLFWSRWLTLNIRMFSAIWNSNLFDTGIWNCVCGYMEQSIHYYGYQNLKSSEFVYRLPKNRMVPKCPVCGLSGMTQKTWSRVAVSREYVTVQRMKRFYALLLAIFGVDNSTNLLNHVAPSTELTMQMWAI